jgi:phosphatidyl-myo-inositol dimannoside synthase
MRGGALLLTNDFPPMRGGEATWYSRLCATLSPDSVVVLAPRMPGDRNFDGRQSYRVIRRWVPVSPHPLARLAQVALLSWHAIGIVRRERITAVHIGHLYLSLTGLVLRFLLGIPYVLYLHGGEMAPYMRRPAVRSIVRQLVRHARLVIVNSNYTRLSYEALGIRHPRIVPVMIGVDSKRFRPGIDPHVIRDRYGLDGARVILTVGRLVERKGHDVVIQALARVRQAVGPVRYLIAGSGPEEQKLRGLARDQGCGEDVIFVGHVSDEDLPLLYAACDVFVMPSRALPERDGIEGFGIVFLEAGASGKPVIGGRSGGISDAVVDGTTGVLVNPQDVEEVAEALIRLLRDREDAARMGEEGRQRAEALRSAWGTEVVRAWTEAERNHDGA